MHPVGVILSAVLVVYPLPLLQGRIRLLLRTKWFVLALNLWSTSIIFRILTAYNYRYTFKKKLNYFNYFSNIS